MEVDVIMISPSRVLFKGKARSVSLPGEEGVFEVLPFHKRIISRLIAGTLLIDRKSYPIRRGIAKVDKNTVNIIVEEE